MHGNSSYGFELGTTEEGESPQQLCEGEINKVDKQWA